jgi:hypothetical protein
MFRQRYQLKARNRRFKRNPTKQELKPAATAVEPNVESSTEDEELTSCRGRRDDLGDFAI